MLVLDRCPTELPDEMEGMGQDRGIGVRRMMPSKCAETVLTAVKTDLSRARRGREVAMARPSSFLEVQRPSWPP
jgi:hypothetical protein